MNNNKIPKETPFAILFYKNWFYFDLLAEIIIGRLIRTIEQKKLKKNVKNIFVFS